MDNYAILYNEIFKSGMNFISSIQNSKSIIEDEPENLFICGMGGSGISGDYISILNQNDNIRVQVVKDYDLPKIMKNDFAVVISYSGNTEETIHMTHQLLEKGIKHQIITSGGELSKIGKANNVDVHLVPKGLQPRAALPYLLGTLYSITKNILHLPQINEDMRKRIIESSSKIENMNKELRNIGAKLLDTLPVILSPKLLEGLGTRFRCQLNENSKLQACNFTAPEFSHNGIVGVDGKVGKTQSFIIIRSNLLRNRTNIHIDFYLNTIEEMVENVFLFESTEETLLEQILEITWKLDYISIFLAHTQNIDPISVPSIVKLKQVLKNSNS